MPHKSLLNCRLLIGRVGCRFLLAGAVLLFANTLAGASWREMGKGLPAARKLSRGLRHLPA
jgi:hypothetical protein